MTSCIRRHYIEYRNTIILDIEVPQGSQTLWPSFLVHVSILWFYYSVVRPFVMPSFFFAWSLLWLWGKVIVWQETYRAHPSHEPLRPMSPAFILLVWWHFFFFFNRTWHNLQCGCFQPFFFWHFCIWRQRLGIVTVCGGILTYFTTVYWMPGEQLNTNTSPTDIIRKPLGTAS